MTRRKIQYWVIPPEASGEFVAAMENVLETYAQPYDPRFPVLTMDEQPVQLLKETRQPISATMSWLAVQVESLSPVLCEDFDGSIHARPAQAIAPNIASSLALAA
jgi:hypothetical protein